MVCPVSHVQKATEVPMSEERKLELLTGLRALIQDPRMMNPGYVDCRRPSCLLGWTHDMALVCRDDAASRSPRSTRATWHCSCSEAVRKGPSPPRASPKSKMYTPLYASAGAMHRGGIGVTLFWPGRFGACLTHGLVVHRLTLERQHVRARELLEAAGVAAQAPQGQQGTPVCFHLLEKTRCGVVSHPLVFHGSSVHDAVTVRTFQEGGLYAVEVCDRGGCVHPLVTGTRAASRVLAAVIMGPMLVGVALLLAAVQMGTAARHGPVGVLRAGVAVTFRTLLPTLAEGLASAVGAPVHALIQLVAWLWPEVRVCAAAKQGSVRILEAQRDTLVGMGTALRRRSRAFDAYVAGLGTAGVAT